MSAVASGLLDYNVNIVKTPAGVRFVNMDNGKLVSKHEVVMTVLRKAGYIINEQVAQLLIILNK